MSLLEGVDSQLLGGALTVVRTLKDAGHEAYFAGGAVRDLLLQRAVSDIDVATSATPDQVEGLFDEALPVGKAFGVMVVVVGSTPYEVTTFRRDSGYADGRHPDRVEFSDAAEDAGRRDFTVNALFMEPLTGEVIDHVGGRQDLERRLIRTVGEPEQRFEEDRLRVLRAVRLACQLDFEVESRTLDQVRAFAFRLGQVSRERVRDEVVKIFTGPDPARGLQMMLDTGLLEAILPEVAAMKSVSQPPEFHPEGDVFEHTLLMFRKAENPDPVLAFAILLHDVGKPPTYTVKERIRFDGHAEVGAEMAREICRRLRLSGDETESIVDLVRCHLKFINVPEMRESTLKRFLRKDNFHLHLELHRLDCLASHGDLSSWEFCSRKLEEISQEALRPDPLINGHDLINLGLEPGPIFTRILRAAEDLQLEGKLRTREEALDWVRRHYG